MRPQAVLALRRNVAVSCCEVLEHQSKTRRRFCALEPGLSPIISGQRQDHTCKDGQALTQQSGEPVRCLHCLVVLNLRVHNVCRRFSLTASGSAARAILVERGCPLQGGLPLPTNSNRDSSNRRLGRRLVSRLPPPSAQPSITVVFFRQPGLGPRCTNRLFEQALRRSRPRIDLKNKLRIHDVSAQFFPNDSDAGKSVAS